MRKYITCLIPFLLVLSCVGDEKNLKKKADSSAVFNVNSSSETGLTFSNNLKPTLERNILEYLYYYNGGGVAIGDINNDGLEDILLTANESEDKLFINKGGLKFEDVTKKSGLKTYYDWSTGTTIDDVNGDGWMDIYICKVAPVSESGTHNLLYLNDGDGTFTESSKQVGLDFSGYSTQASFFDYDRDGDLDMYLLNHSIHSVSSYGKTSKRTEKDTLSGDRLFENRLNESEGQFVDVTDAAGIFSSALGYGLGLITTDINQDGWEDIYVGNDFHENDYIYLNNGDKTFTESMKLLLNHSSKFTMGVDVADMNDDGLTDIFTTDMLPYDEAVALKSGGEDTDQVFNIRADFGFEDQYARNHFHLKNQEQGFSDIALMTNTYASDWSWSVLLQDFDNDGRSDIFISNGIVKRPNDLDYIKFVNNRSQNINRTLTQPELDQFLNEMPAQKLNNLLFFQKGELKFSDVTEAAIGTPTFSNGAAYADLDKDGDLDLVVNNINDEVSLLENTTNTKHHFIAFQLKDNTTEATLKGSIIKLYFNGKMKQQSYTTTRGYQASSTHFIHFGLGTANAIDSVVVVWPDHTKQVVSQLSIDQYHVIEKTDQTSPHNFLPSATNPKKVSAFPFKHLENAFSDFNADKLIPELLSREGPAVIYEDFDKDGQKDLFIGGARYQESRLFFRQGDKFVVRKNADLKKDSKYEDIDAAVIDFDNDGDLDLYVISGGNDEKELNEQLQDRIYLNDGKGNLKRIPLSLPHTNGGSIAVGDVDGDGYEDMFIGARSIPASYGLSPYSFVLKNKKGLGVEILKKERFGMVTSSQWVDIDGDQDLDLVFCGDWMNISVLENQGDSKLELKSTSIGLGQSAGLWNKLYLHDLNKDGQLDIIAANAGTNFKWKASVEQPVKLYVTDLDKNGQTEPLIFNKYFATYMPFMSLDELKAQVPLVRKQFTTYQAYAQVIEVENFNLVKPEEIVERKQIQELRSMVYLSNEGQYKGIPLPFQAQLSTIQDFHINEKGELLFVGNHHDYLTELGKSGGNSGGKFKQFDPETGMFSDYKSLSLPQNLNTRGITALGNNEYLISCNNNVQYLLKDE